LAWVSSTPTLFLPCGPESGHVGSPDSYLEDV
jgi:hypothetical protein